MIRRSLRAALGGLALCALLPAAAEADFFDRLGLGGATYKSFEGKFVDVEAPKAIAENEKEHAARLKNFSDTGHFNGSATWDGIPTPKLKAYATGIAAKLLAGWIGEKPKLRVWITANPGLVAESTGDGNLYISRGWFDECDSEDEIAAIMAHEISHILLDHFARDEANEGRRSAVTGAATAAATAFTLGSMRVQQNGNAIAVTQNQKKLQSDMRKTLLIKFAIDEVASYTLNAPWARRQEDEADLLGTDLLYRAHYNVLAMRSALERLNSYEKSVETKVSTLSDEYDAVLKQQLAQGDLEAAKKSLSDMFLTVAMEQASDLRRRLNRNHPSTDDRIKDISNYIAREYEDDPGPTPKKAELKAALADKSIQASLRNHKIAFDAGGMLSGKSGGAIAKAQQALAGVTANDPYPLRVAGQALHDSGQTAKGIVYLKRAAASPESSYSTVSMLAGDYAGAGNFIQARATLDMAVRRFGSEEATYPIAITIALKQGDKVEAARIYKLCVALKNGELVEQCKVSNGDKCTGSEFLCAMQRSGEGVGDTVGNVFDTSKILGNGK